MLHVKRIVIFMKKTGLIASPEPIRSYSYEICKTYEDKMSDYPKKFTLPEKLIPPVYNQGTVGACVGFSSCSCAESHFRKNGDEERLSPGFFYGREECRGNYKGEGLYADYAMKGATKIGFVPYHLYPILKEVPEALAFANARNDLLDYGQKKKPESYISLAYALADKTWDNIRTALYKDNCAVVLISHDYFRGGSHAIMGIGYSNEKIVNNKKIKGRYIEFQNSWGKTWGSDGRDLIPVEQIDDAYVFVWEPIDFPFVDVMETDWFFDDVRSVYFSGLVSGTSVTTFEPKANFIRGDVAVIISRMLERFQNSMNTFVKSKIQQGMKATNISFQKWKGKNLPFNDINPSDYYYEAIADMYANGIMNGKSETEFEPTTTMTRAEVCATVVRVVEIVLTKLKESIPTNYVLPSVSVEKFVDIDESKWYNSYIQKACSMGIMNGNGNGTFAPEKNIVRCEGAAIFHRVFKVVENLMMQAI